VDLERVGGWCPLQRKKKKKGILRRKKKREKKTKSLHTNDFHLIGRTYNVGVDEFDHHHVSTWRNPGRNRKSNCVGSILIVNYHYSKRKMQSRCLEGKKKKEKQRECLNECPFGNTQEQGCGALHLSETEQRKSALANRL
jgi:uncharacterized UPF0160 family protein